VLAICRGMQLFNVFHRGTLHQHIEGHRLVPPDEHPVRLSGRLAGILGCGEAMVNSRHHQAADAIGDGLSVCAVADNHIIEALVRPDRRFAVAVQWHPEDRVACNESDRRLFDAFADACGRLTFRAP
jgi:putative glutamine amidotransferase